MHWFQDMYLGQYLSQEMAISLAKKWPSAPGKYTKYSVHSTNTGVCTGFGNQFYTYPMDFENVVFSEH